MDSEIWDDHPAEPQLAGPLPAGFTAETIAAVAQAARLARQAGRDPSRAAWDVAWGLHPALPASLIGEAVDHVLARA